MAGRKDKNTVDYFPHYVTTGKTMFILENQFGHIGYSIWFKTLELLGSSENHYIDLRDDTDLLFLISKFKTTEEQINLIYNLLAKLGAIDSDLWSNKIIFSSNFIANIEDAYRRRNNKCLHKLDLCSHLSIKLTHKSNKNTQDYTKKSKVKESKGNEIIDEIYFLYPTKCPIKNSSTGKTKTNKDKIKSLLKTISVEDLKATIVRYISECTKSKVYIKNFGSFLNNLPDYENEPAKWVYVWKCKGYPKEEGTKERYELDLKNQQEGHVELFKIYDNQTKEVKFPKPKTDARN